MSYKVYPVVSTEQVCEDYEVFVNGERAELNTARVSAYPFNRRWPGHQRQVEQTELVNFLSMESDEEIELRIKPHIPAYGVRIRPRDLEASAQIEGDGSVTIRVNGAAQFTVEPCGRNRALHVFIDPVGGYNVKKDDPAVRYFGPGEHDVGSLYLQSGQTLFIDEGAVVYATVYALHAENVRILGRGILDNSRNKATILYDANAEGNDEAVANAKREFTVNFLCCKNVTVDGITIRHSLIYNVDCMSCENIRINNVKIIGCWRFNSDGVHFANCVHGSLTNSFLRTYDDSVCVRGFANYEYDRFLNDEREEDLSFVCRDILVKNCVVWNDWGKNLQVGTETHANEICDIRFEDCKLIHSTGKALTVWLVDDARIHDVIFENTLVEYDDYMLPMTIQKADDDPFVNLYDADYGGNLVEFKISWHHEYSLVSEAELGGVDGVTVQDLHLFAVQRPVFKFTGHAPENAVKNVTFRGIYWNGEAISAELFERQTVKNEFVEGIRLENGPVSKDTIT